MNAKVQIFKNLRKVTHYNDKELFWKTKFLILILIHCNLFKTGNVEKQAITFYFETFLQWEKKYIDSQR